MKQEFVTLPREVVEQALKAMSLCRPHMYDHASNTQDCAFDLLCDAVNALRTALDQPQAEQPAMTPIAQRKLDDLVASGYTISGYSVYHERKHQHGFVTGAGLVGWWKPEGMEYPQPRDERGPVAWMVTSEMQDGTRSTYPMIGRFKDVQDCCDFGEPVPLIYQHPQPKREPLTDEQIDAIADAMPGGLEGFMKGWGWRQFARAVIEATHNIK